MPTKKGAKWVVEAQEPCGRREWVRLSHPAVFRDETYADGGSHDGLFEAESEQAAIQQWLDAYPAYPHGLVAGAKAYLAFRAFREQSPRVFKLVEVVDG